MTAEEIKNDMIQKLGTDFGSLFNSLYNEITWLTFRWIEFVELYGTKETRLELMNRSAPFLFFTIQKVLWENLLLGISRITDPPISMGKRNMTLTAIPTFLTDDNFKKEIENDLKELMVESMFCRDWRNRWIAHLDYELATDRDNAKPLETGTRKKLKIAIKRIHSIYNKVEFEYLETTTGFEYLKSDRGAISLLYRIEDGLRFDKEVHERKLRGEWIDNKFQSKV